MYKVSNELIVKIPRRTNRIFDIVLFCLLFLVSFSYFFYGYQYFDLGTYHYDEGIVAYGAQRILDGDIPYRDFWTLYAPGQFYILAAVFKIFGTSIKVTRLFAIVVLTITVCCIYFLIKKLCSRIFGILAFFLSLAWLKSYMVFNRPGQLSILFFILSCFSLLNFFPSQRYRWITITGILIGIVTLFRQDFGVYIFIPMFLIIILKQLNYSKGWKTKLSLILKNEFLLFIGFFIVILPLLVYLITNSAFKGFINDAIAFPATIYPKVRDMPFPALKANTIIFYVPLFTFLLGCIRLLFYNWNSKIENAVPWFILFLLLSGICLSNYSFVRTDIPHLLPVMIFAIILFVLLLNDFLNNPKNKFIYRCKNAVLTMALVISFILCSYSIIPSFTKLKYFSNNEIQARLDIPRAKGFYDDSEAAQSQVLAIKYIQDNIDKDERIFVGNLRHDKVVNSDVMFYFLSERHSATKYYELHPGLTNTQKIQQEIINDLIKTNVRYIIVWSDSEKVNEPNESSKSSGVLDLDNFIQKNYKMEKNFGSYVILRHI